MVIQSCELKWNLEQMLSLATLNIWPLDLMMDPCFCWKEIYWQDDWLLKVIQMRMNTVQHWLKNYADFALENEHFYHRTSSGNRGSVTSFHMEKHRISAKVYDPPRATQTLPLPRSGVGALSVTGRPQPTRDPIRERWWAIKSG